MMSISINDVRSGWIIIIIERKVPYCINTLSIGIYILNEATVFYWSKSTKWGSGRSIKSDRIFIPKAKTFGELSH